MSSSSFSQGIQSCIQPCVIEPRAVKLKLAPPKSHNFSTGNNHDCDKKDNTSNISSTDWSFLQSLSNTSHCNKTVDPYAHPMVKRSSSMLSEKSWEMCTESLGSESGSNAGEISGDISLLSLEINKTCFARHDTTTNNNNNTICVSKRVNNRACNFPPPLPSITDFGVIRPHRQDGRLILEAITSPRPYFHADRSDGRLILCFSDSFFGSECGDDEVDYDDAEQEEGESENQEECCEEKCVENVEDDEMEVTKFARPSRCKESGNRVGDIFGDGSNSFSLSLSRVCFTTILLLSLFVPFSLLGFQPL